MSYIRDLTVCYFLTIQHIIYKVIRWSNTDYFRWKCWIKWFHIINILHRRNKLQRCINLTFSRYKNYVNGPVKDCGISSAFAMEIHVHVYHCLTLSYHYMIHHKQWNIIDFPFGWVKIESSLENKCQTADPDWQNLNLSGKLSFFFIYKFWQNWASVPQVSDFILKTEKQNFLSIK